MECRRALVRATAIGQISEAQANDVRALVAGACADWTLIEPSAAVLDRAGLPFPAEPIRALDAAHLASALVAREATGALELVTTDERVRKNARLLGLAVLP